MFVPVQSAPSSLLSTNPIPWWQTNRARTAFYALVLVAVGSPLCFARIDRGMLLGDESAFATTTDIMLETGDWVVPTIDGIHPHLNATPLYNWLCCLTAGLTDDTPLRYRLWSAIFGVGCALAVLLLGTELFRPEVGFLAGLLLITNQHFLFHHGPREGVMEPGLMLFHTLMIFSYARANRPGTRTYYWWVMVGINLGGAVMMKPPVIGGFFFTLICVHHLFARSDLSLRARLGRPILALAVGVLVASPWYALLYERLGPYGLKQLLFFNSVGRASTIQGVGERELPRWIYVRFIWDSAKSARLFWPALGVGMLCVVFGWRRRGWSLLALLAGGFTLAISCAATKSPHYVYNAIPYLSVLTAALLLVGLLHRPAVASENPRMAWLWRGLTIIGIALAAYFLQADGRRIYWWWQIPQWEYPPLQVEHVIESHAAEKRVHLILYRYPEPRGTLDQQQLQLWVGCSDRFYQTRLHHAEHVMEIGELNRLLAEGKPTVVFLPPTFKLADLEQAGLSIKPDRALRLRTRFIYYPVLTFHGAEAELELREFFQKGEVPPSEPDKF